MSSLGHRGQQDALSPLQFCNGCGGFGFAPEDMNEATGLSEPLCDHCFEEWRAGQRA